MTHALQFAALGLGIGAIYALLGQGLVVIHGGSGVLNLGHGAMAMLAAYVFRQLHEVQGWSTPTALLSSIAMGAGLGIALHVLVMHPLRNASPLSRVVATLGVVASLQGLVMLIWGTRPLALNSMFGFGSVTVGPILIPVDRLWMLGIAGVITLVLWAGYRFTSAGLAVRGAATAPEVAAGFGWSPEALALTTWAIGGALAAFAGILIAPVVGLTPDEMPLYVIPVTAAALVGRFTSFPLTLIGAVAIGVGQSEVTNYVSFQGAVWTIPFLLIVVLMLVRGTSIPIRGFAAGRLPAMGSGRSHPVVTAITLVAAAYLILFVFPPDMLDALTISLGWAVIMLSVVVLLGYTNQLSFEQMAMGGLTALVAARLLIYHHLPFVVSVICATVASLAIGVTFALPALRTRGVSLAVVTLGLSVVVFEAITTNGKYTGGADGLQVGTQHLFGIDLDPIRFPQRYSLLALAVFAGCATLVARLRRGRTGSALGAVRTNERAAAALGINVFEMKLYAFVIGAAVAGLGGILLAFRSPTAQFANFDPLASILAVSFAVIGGVAFVLGPIAGSTFVAGGIGTWILHQLWPSANPGVLVALGGVSVIVVIVAHPDGVVELQLKQLRAIGRVLGVHLPKRWARRNRISLLQPPAIPRVEQLDLEIKGVGVHYGGVAALQNVSLSVKSGQIVGLIGPNGAGKTTLIDAVTGFTAPSGGTVALGDATINRWRVHRRAQAGISRSFQSLELFEESSVRENLLVACDRRDIVGYLLDLIRPRPHVISPVAAAAAALFGLLPHLDERVADLSYGYRRLVAIARALATSPSVLLLDEPAAGLSGSEIAALGGALRTVAEEWGVGILLVEHDMSLVMTTCDRVVVLDFGRCIATGTPAEIRRDAAVIAAYLGGNANEGDHVQPTPRAYA